MSVTGSERGLKNCNCSASVKERGLKPATTYWTKRDSESVGAGVRPRIRFMSFAKSGMFQAIQNGQSHFFRHRHGTYARRASAVARAGKNELPCGVQHLFANLIQRPAQADTARK